MSKNNLIFNNLEEGGVGEIPTLLPSGLVELRIRTCRAHLLALPVAEHQSERRFQVTNQAWMLNRELFFEKAPNHNNGITQIRY